MKETLAEKRNESYEKFTAQDSSCRIVKKIKQEKRIERERERENIIKKWSYGRIDGRSRKGAI